MPWIHASFRAGEGFSGAIKPRDVLGIVAVRQLYPWGDWQLLSTYRGSPDWRLFGDGLRVENEPFFNFVVGGITSQTKNARLFFVMPAAATRVVFLFLVATHLISTVFFTTAAVGNVDAVIHRNHVYF